jgi:hypothetical protein
LIERKLVKWSREKISRCFYSFLRKLIFMRKDAEAEGEQRELNRLLESKPSQGPTRSKAAIGFRNGSERRALMESPPEGSEPASRRE